MLKSLAVLLGLLVVLFSSVQLGMAATTNYVVPSNAVDIMWQDYCARTQDTRCVVSPTPTPSPTATPTQTPSPTITIPTATPTVAPTPTIAPTPTPTPTPSPTSTPPPTTGGYMIIGASELAALPTNTAAFTYLKGLAEGTWPSPDLCNQDVKHGVYVFSSALLYARTGTTSYRDRAISGIIAAKATQRTCSVNGALSAGRQLGSYVIAADLVGYRDSSFLTWLNDMKTKTLGGNSRWYSIDRTCLNAPNNWGAWNCATEDAITIFLHQDMTEQWNRFQGFTGDRSKFVYPWDANDGDTSWECLPSSAFTPIELCPGNPRDGNPPEDSERAGSYPTISPTYVAETTSGLTIQAELLRRAGYPSWSRMKPLGDFKSRWNVWNPSSISYGDSWLFNKRLGTAYPEKTPAYGRMLTGYNWLWQ